MTNRRVFIRSGASLAMLTALPVYATLARQRAMPFDSSSLVLVDSGLDTGPAFAAAAAAEGRTVRTFNRDVAGLWMSAIEPRLRTGPVVLCGHTSSSTLFCLDLLARDYGAHTIQSNEEGESVTWVISSSPMRRAALAPLGARTQWSDSDA